MNNFATRMQRPSAKEYLEVSLDQVVERLNNNPTGHQSEEALIHAVITVRAAKINERLSRRLNCLTAVLALATICLVVAPFVAPSVERKQIEAQFGSHAQLIESHKQSIEQLTHSMSKLTYEQDALAAELERSGRRIGPDDSF